MAVVFDALSPQMTADGGTSMSVSMTIGTGANRALLVPISISGNTNTFTVTWGATTLTAQVAGVSNGFDEGTFIYGLLNPASGTNTLSISWTGSQSACAAGISFTGVEQSSIANAFTHANNSVGSVSPATVTVTSAVGDIAVACQSSNFCTLTEDNTSVYHYVSLSGMGLTANRAAGAASVPLSATQSVNQTWSASGVNVHAAAVSVTSGGTVTDAGTKFKRTILYQSIAQPVFFTAPVTWNDQTNWPDFAPGRPRVLNFNPLAFVPDIDRYLLITDQTNWPDFAPGKPRLPLHSPWSFIPTPAQVWFPPNVTPDMVPTTAKRVVDFIPWSFVPSPAQVFFPYAPWDDFTRRKPQLPDTQPLAFVSVVVAAAAQVWYPPNTWPDLLLRAKPAIDTNWLAFTQPQPTITTIGDWPDFVRRPKVGVDTTLSWVPLVTPPAVVILSPSYWPDFAPRARQPLNFTPATPFIQVPAQVWFPYGPWDDFARRKPVPQDTQRFAWSNFVPAPTFFLVPDRWADFVRSKPVPLNYVPLTLTQTVQPPWTQWTQWPDRIWRKPQPVDTGPPLAYLQLIRTPWNELSRWPDFVPIRTKAGLQAALQQFLARFPGIITQATVTGILSAFEVNSDVAAITILVRQSQPAVRAAVSIQEIGTI